MATVSNEMSDGADSADLFSQPEIAYWGVEMQIPGQQPRLLKRRFVESYLANRCRLTLQRQMPHARFQVVRQ